MCLILIVVGNKVEIHYPQFHYIVMLKLMAVCGYMSLIIYAKKIVDETSHKIIENMCISSNMGTRKQWITIEFYAFFINLIVLVIFLFISLKYPKYMTHDEFKDKKETVFERIKEVYETKEKTNKDKDFQIIESDKITEKLKAMESEKQGDLPSPICIDDEGEKEKLKKLWS